jgi:hypothetical protein
MKIGKIEVKQVAEGVITIQENGEHESRCFVSKMTDAEVKGESIKGDYLHLLAGAVANMRNLNDEEIEALFMPLMAELPAKYALQQFARNIIAATLGVPHG